MKKLIRKVKSKSIRIAKPLLSTKAVLLIIASYALFITVFPVYGMSTTSIEINEFENRMYVGTSQAINVIVHPTDSDDKEIKYVSSDTSVATISASGKIEAVGKGKTNIIVSSGKIKKTLELTVTVETKKLTLSDTYLTMKPGEKYKLSATVTPSDANQKLKYKSADESVVKVNKKGIITAVDTGSTSVIVSNDELTTSIYVIVNTSTDSSGTIHFGYDDASGEDTDETSDSSHINKSSTLVHKTEDYSLLIDDSEIINPNISFDPKLIITKNDEGYAFHLGSKNYLLPGTAKISFKNTDMQKCRFIYLMNPSTEKYEFYGELSDSEMKTDVSGSYLITYDKIKDDRSYIKIALISAAVITLAFVAYMIMKRALLL